MDALLLQFIGVFAKAQDIIDSTVQHQTRMAMPELGPLISERFLNRMNDDDRLTLLHAVATQVSYSGDLSRFDEVCKRAKIVRDRLTHGGVMPARGGEEYILSLTSKERAREISSPKNLSTADVQQFLAEASWLLAHVGRLGSEAGAFKTSIVVAEG